VSVGDAVADAVRVGLGLAPGVLEWVAVEVLVGV